MPSQKVFNYFCCEPSPGGSRLVATSACSCEYCVYPDLVKSGGKAKSKCSRLEPALASAPHYVLRPRSCEICSSRENIRPCGDCLITYYCSEEHKVSDSARHAEKCCLAVSNWLFWDQRMHGRAKHIEDKQTLFKVDVTLHLFPNLAATEISLQRLLRIYNSVGYSETRGGPYSDITELVPVLYMRQGRDDAAYNFIYKHVPGLDMDYLSNSYQSFADIHACCGLGHQVLLTLIAIKALRQIKDMENMSVSLGGHVAQEIIDEISEHLGTDFLEEISGFDRLQATGSATWRQETISRMESMVRRCVFQTWQRNKHIWRRLLDTERLAARDVFGQFSPRAVGWESKDAAETVAVRQYQVWMETPGSHEILRSGVAAAEAAGWISANQIFEPPSPLKREG